MIELELTPKIKQWLDTAPEKRDISEGALLLLRITRNQILYRNIMASPKRKAATLEYHLQKHLKTRLIDTTREEVKQMMVQVDAIVSSHGLTAERSSFQKGKRADHDELPDEIKQLYVDNADIMRRMRDAHTQLRMISPRTSTCPDSDRYPLAKAIIDYDSRYRNNWNVYDHYIKGSPVNDLIKAVDARTERINAVKTLNLLLGKYAIKPSPSSADRIKTLYAKVVNPPDALSQKMIDAGLL